MSVYDNLVHEGATLASLNVVLVHVDIDVQGCIVSEFFTIDMDGMEVESNEDYVETVHRLIGHPRFEVKGIYK